MGLFGRKSDDGFYRGDAPVSAPGLDGEAPTAYTRPSAADRVDYIPTDTTTARSDIGASYVAGDYDGPTALTTDGPSVAVPNAAPGPRAGFPRAPQQRVDTPFAPPGGATGARALDPATAARVQQQLAQAGRRVSKLGCFLIAIPVIGALVGVGFAVYGAIHAVNATDGIISGLSSAATPAGDDTPITPVGTPVTFDTEDASYRITVYGAESQRGDGWGYDGPAAPAALIVGAEIARTDAGTEPVSFEGWNWSVIGDDGQQVLGDIISHFAPSLDGPALKGGDSIRGFVSFATEVKTVRLAVSDRPFGEPVARWQLPARTPEVVTGVVGTPAQGEISRPGFTVTVGQTEIVPADDDRVGTPPESGQYLAVPVTFAGIPYMDGSIGNVASGQLVFIPEGSTETDRPLISAAGGLDGARSFFPVSADAPAKGMLAFDTTATRGELQLRGSAGQPIISWRIAAS